MGFAGFLADVLSEKSSKRVFFLSSSVFAVVYVFMVGIVFQLPYVLPETFPRLAHQIIFEGFSPQYPVLIVYFQRQWVFSINPEAAISLTTLSVLVGLNAAAIIHAQKHLTCRTSSKIHFSWMAVVLSFFSFFTCCGSGIVFTILLSAGAGLSVLGFLQEYGRLFTFLSAVLLVFNLYAIYREHRKKLVKSF
ncbi:MAG: hypothetical protein QXY84_02865 [Candidatus Caldarchaeum sp.]